MNIKKVILIFSIIVLFVSVIAAGASAYSQETHDIQSILESNSETDLTGCCSVALQLEGNNSMFAFRRDAGNAAEIFIEKVNWHGKEAVKQYKTDAGYFCQVIITNDGWVIGYGGIDDGVDNERIENITGSMMTNNTTAFENGLAQVQDIKAAYGLGHLVMKAPNGTYGIATATGHQTGKLAPGEYISLPNKIGFMRTGNVDLNTSDKVEAMANLAISDGFGLTRRDVTTFNFQCVNETTNVTNAYISNDDGSMWGMSTGGLCDNVNFTGKYIKAEDIPVAPKYMHMGNITFTNENQTNGNANIGNASFIGYETSMMSTKLIVVVFAIIVFFAFHIVRALRYSKR